MLHHFANGLIVATLGASVAITGLTHDAPKGSFVGGEAARAMMHSDKPTNVPVWQPAYADRFAGCAKSLPSGVIPSTVVVVDLTGDVIRMDFDHAWKVSHNRNTADDVWLVGACR